MVSPTTVTLKRSNEDPISTSLYPLSFKCPRVFSGDESPRLGDQRSDRCSEQGPFRVRTRVPTACTFGQDANRTQKGNARKSERLLFTRTSHGLFREGSGKRKRVGHQSDTGLKPFISFHVLSLPRVYSVPGNRGSGARSSTLLGARSSAHRLELQQVVIVGIDH